MSQRSRTDAHVKEYEQSPDIGSVKKYELGPVTDRVKRIREKYRTTRPSICIARYKIVTEFYKDNPQLQGILKRAKNFKNICEKLPALINEDEVIVGWQATKYRACALYPEISFGWFLDELRAGTIPHRDVDPYDIDDRDAEYILQTGDFWRKECLSAKVDEYIPLGYFDAASHTSVQGIRAHRRSVILLQISTKLCAKALPLSNRKPGPKWPNWKV